MFIRMYIYTHYAETRKPSPLLTRCITNVQNIQTVSHIDFIFPPQLLYALSKQSDNHEPVPWN